MLLFFCQYYACWYNAVSCHIFNIVCIGCLYVHNIFVYYYYYKIYSCLLVTRWQSSGKSRSQQEIKAIYPSTLQMLYAVLICVLFCSCAVDRWSGSNWRLWSNPFFIAHNAPTVTGTFFVFNFHILLTLISRSLYLLSISVYFVLIFESSSMAILISRQVFYFLSCSTISGQFASIVWSVHTGRYLIICHTVQWAQFFMRYGFGNSGVCCIQFKKDVSFSYVSKCINSELLLRFWPMMMKCPSQRTSNWLSMWRYCRQKYFVLLDEKNWGIVVEIWTWATSCGLEAITATHYVNGRKVNKHIKKNSQTAIAEKLNLGLVHVEEITAVLAYKKVHWMDAVSTRALKKTRLEECHQLLSLRKWK